MIASKQIICFWNSNTQIDFPDTWFHNEFSHIRGRFTSLNWNIYSSFYKRWLFFKSQTKYAIFIRNERNVLRMITRKSNSNKMALFRKLLCCALSIFYSYFFHILKSRSLEGPAFQEHQRIICMYNKTERTLRQERKTRSFVRTTIRKDKVYISSENVYLLFSENIAISLSLW